MIQETKRVAPAKTEGKPVMKSKSKKASKKTVKTKSKAKPKKSAKVATADKVTINFKVPPKEAKALKAKADRLTNSNLTQMVRLAVHAWNPKKTSLEGIRKSTRA